MATQINTIKNWFKTGLKPTQSQFWAWIDSFWHKDETIPITSINNLQSLLDGKADKVSQGKIKIDGFWFDTENNTDRFAIEIGNTFEGWIGDRYLSGKIMALPISFPEDIDDKTKIKLAIDIEL